MALARTRDFSYRNRPVFRIDLYNGNSKDPVNGLRDEWRWNGEAPNTDIVAVEWLIDTLQDAYTIGYRDFALFMPSGAPADSNYYAANHWYTIPEARREILQEALKNWISTHQEVEPPGYFTFGLYIGIPARDDYNREELELPLGAMTLPDTDKINGRQWLTDQVENWIEIGVSRLWLNGGSDTTAKDELGGRSLYEGLLEQQEFYESIGITTVGADAIPLSNYEYTEAGNPIPGDGNIDEEYSLIVPWTASSDWVDLWDRKTAPFYFDYNTSAQQCTVTSSSSSETFFNEQEYDANFEAGDYLKVNNLAEHFTQGKYNIREVYDGDTLTLYDNGSQDCETLPIQNVFDVYCEGVIFHGRTTDNWSLPYGYEEISIMLSLDCCYTEDRIKSYLDRGFRLGANTDLTLAQNVKDTYDAWLGEKSVYRRIIRRHN